MKKLGFIGFGEAAFCISSGLAENGITGIIAYDKMQEHPEIGKLVRKRAQEAGVTLKASAGEVAQEVDVLFAVVPPSYALEACRSVVGSLRPGLVYADVSASLPRIKEDIWDLLKDTGVLFTDGAMMGLLPVNRHLVPITASGNGAQAFYDAVTPLGMKVDVIGEKPGAASAIKLLRSIYMKGHQALLVEMMCAAEAYGVFDEVADTVGGSMDGVSLATLIQRVFPGVGIHAVRRSAELNGTIEMLEAQGIDTSMTRATKAQLDLVAGLDLKAVYGSEWPKSADWREVFHYINEQAQK